MLIEIRCDVFNLYGNDKEDKKVIRFHRGLNTIIGGKENDKSILLMAIDYCFGGDKLSDYYRNRTEEYTVCFAFRFNSIEYFFSRHTSFPKEVNVCDKDYHRREGLNINEYRKRLMAFFGIRYYNHELWKYTNSFFRFSNYGEDVRQNAENLICVRNVNELGKIFDFYEEIDYLNRELKKNRDKKEVYDKVIAYERMKKGMEFSNVHYKSKDYSKREDKLDYIFDEIYRTITEGDVEWEEATAGTIMQIRKMKQHYKKLLSKYHVVLQNNDGQIVPKMNDLTELKNIFPNVNIRHIQKVEAFHQKISSIMKEQMDEEVENLRPLITATLDEIKRLETELSEKEVINSKIKFILKKYSREINSIEELCYIHNVADEIEEVIIKIKESLNEEEKTILQKIKELLNHKLKYYNNPKFGMVSNMPPVILLNDDKSRNEVIYKYKNNIKNEALALLDLGILEMSYLPAVAYDMHYFADFENVFLAKLMRLYSEVDRGQIFIPFSVDEHEGDVVEIVKSNMVLITDLL